MFEAGGQFAIAIIISLLAGSTVWLWLTAREAQQDADDLRVAFARASFALNAIKRQRRQTSLNAAATRRAKALAADPLMQGKK